MQLVTSDPAKERKKEYMNYYLKDTIKHSNDIKEKEKNKQIKNKKLQFCNFIKILMVLSLCFRCGLYFDQVFGNIALVEKNSINKHNNFQSFIQALMLLFR